MFNRAKRLYYRLTINAGNSCTATLNVSPPVGAADITVTADGAYASDSCAASTFGVPTPEGEGIN